jgi:hypothetical protein
MAEVSVRLGEDGGAWVDLAGPGGGELRDAVELADHEEAHRVPALDGIVLHFDFYGRLAAIEVTGAVGSVLPPALLDAADPAA